MHTAQPEGIRFCHWESGGSEPLSGMLSTKKKDIKYIAMLKINKNGLRHENIHCGLGLRYAK